MKLGLGVGLDMPWGDSFGFDIVNNKPTSKTQNFLNLYNNDFNYSFASCHIKDRSELNIKNYIEAFHAFYNINDKFKARALHHTFLNLGTTEKYNKTKIIEFTNQLSEELNIDWIVEDLGIWQIKGKTLPYPLPPFLNNEGLNSCIQNITKLQSHLRTPLLIEFPGFTDGTNFYIGQMHAFDFFNKVAKESQCAVTLDTGHLISYQWLLGKRNEELFEELHRLPLEHCFEIHLSGCQIVNNRFMDFHHGVIMDEQLIILEKLISLCPNLKAITYEDPKYDDTGRLFPKSVNNFLKLKSIVSKWTV